MNVQVLCFARLREIVGDASAQLECASGARIAEVWENLSRAHPQLAALRSSTRAARNGALVGFEQELAEGDEIAFLPPVGGG